MTVESSDLMPRRIFTCLSTDTKPTASSNPRPSHNDELVEVDTGDLYRWANGAWVLDTARRNVAGVNFIPSAYSGNKSATTTVTGQSEAIASGAKRLRVRNLDGTNFALVAFGTSAANAESNAANGVAIEAGQVETMGIPSNATHYAYVGDTGTVILNVTQGV